MTIHKIFEKTWTGTIIVVRFYFFLHNQLINSSFFLIFLMKYKITNPKRKYELFSFQNNMSWLKWRKQTKTITQKKSDMEPKLSTTDLAKYLDISLQALHKKLKTKNIVPLKSSSKTYLRFQESRKLINFP